MKMKKLFVPCLLFLLTAAVVAGCKKESTPTRALTEKVDLAVSAPQSNSSGFANGPYGAVTGNARIYLTNGKYQLALENFSSSNGPDLKVYLSKEQNPVGFVNLGSLRSTSGDQVYDIPAGADVKDYTYALIYCQQFSHLFGYAKLTY
jgi:hypothetical protein